MSWSRPLSPVDKNSNRSRESRADQHSHEGFDMTYQPDRTPFDTGYFNIPSEEECRRIILGSDTSDPSEFSIGLDTESTEDSGGDGDGNGNRGPKAARPEQKQHIYSQWRQTGTAWTTKVGMKMRPRLQLTIPSSRFSNHKALKNPRSWSVQVLPTENVPTSRSGTKSKDVKTDDIDKTPKVEIVKPKLEKAVEAALTRRTPSSSLLSPTRTTSTSISRKPLAQSSSLHVLKLRHNLSQRHSTPNQIQRPTSMLEPTSSVYSSPRDDLQRPDPLRSETTLSSSRATDATETPFPPSSVTLLATGHSETFPTPFAKEAACCRLCRNPMVRYSTGELCVSCQYDFAIPKDLFDGTPTTLAVDPQPEEMPTPTRAGFLPRMTSLPALSLDDEPIFRGGLATSTATPFTTRMMMKGGLQQRQDTFQRESYTSSAGTSQTSLFDSLLKMVQRPVGEQVWPNSAKMQTPTSNKATSPQGPPPPPPPSAVAPRRTRPSSLKPPPGPLATRRFLNIHARPADIRKPQSSSPSPLRPVTISHAPTKPVWDERHCSGGYSSNSSTDVETTFSSTTSVSTRRTTLNWDPEFEKDRDSIDPSPPFTLGAAAARDWDVDGVIRPSKDVPSSLGYHVAEDYRLRRQKVVKRRSAPVHRVLSMGALL